VLARRPGGRRRRQDIAGQTRQVLAAVDALLARAGTDKSKILMCQIFLADLADFAAMNAVWEAWVAARPDAAARHRAGRSWPSRSGRSRWW
jgi:enamine deaminase RidA (YjgF/YER057c/UK114 family)